MTAVNFRRVRTALKEYEGSEFKDYYDEPQAIRVLPAEAALPDDMPDTELLFKMTPNGKSADIYRVINGSLQKDGNIQTNFLVYSFADEIPFGRFTPESPEMEPNAWGAMSRQTENGIGGIHPSSVDSLMASLIQIHQIGSSVHFDAINKENRVYLLESLLDPVKDGPLAGKKDMIAEAIKRIPADNHEGIYIASYATSDAHQVSLVFDNRKKTLFITDSNKAGQLRTFPLPDITVTEPVREGLMRFDQIATPLSDSAVACGILTIINTLNLASLLSTGKATNYRLDRPFLLYLMIIECISPEDRYFLTAETNDKIHMAAKLYAKYEECSTRKEKSPFIDRIDKMLAEIMESIETQKQIMVGEDKVDNSLFEVPPLLETPNKQTVYSSHSSVMFKEKVPLKETHNDENSIKSATSDNLEHKHDI